MWEQLLQVSIMGCTNTKAIQLTITSSFGRAQARENTEKYGYGQSEQTGKDKIKSHLMLMKSL